MAWRLFLRRVPDMRGWKIFSLLAALLLGGCLADTDAQDETLDAEELQHGTTQLLEGEEPSSASTTQQASPAPAPWSPSTAAAATTGGKPQPDPWRAATLGGPNKPQPDPWNPAENQYINAK